MAQRERERIRIVKSLLTAIVMTATLSGVAHSQGSARTGVDQLVHPGTAILDSMGIDAGKPIPVQTPPDAKAEHTRATRVSDPSVKQ
jgi:hypothetical protein